jgi:hypothetical protein
MGGTVIQIQAYLPLPFIAAIICSCWELLPTLTAVIHDDRIASIALYVYCVDMDLLLHEYTLLPMVLMLSCVQQGPCSIHGVHQDQWECEGQDLDRVSYIFHVLPYRRYRYIMLSSDWLFL